MHEFELKLEVPPARLRGVQRAVARLQGKAQLLQATYYDTPSQQLRRHGLVLRVRREGPRWVQALKASGRSAVERLEHEVPLAYRGRAAPLPDVALHAGSALEGRLADALEGDGPAPQWVALFSTHVERVAAMVSEGSTQVEVAFDRGHVIAAGEKAGLQEIEFELKEGSPRAAAAIASRWMASHGLWLSTVSKFEKCMRLADGNAAGPPALARPVEYGRRASFAEIARLALASGLDQVLRNASEVAAGHGSGGHIHQLRVGIRRVRTVLREMLPGAAPPVEAPLVEAFRALGARRDIDHVLQQVEPMLREAGSPPLRPAADASLPEPAQVVRATAFQEALLELVALAHEDGPAATDDEPPRRRFAKLLRGLSKKTLRDGLRFERIDGERQHRVRKRAKRLRYLGEFAAPLFGAKKVETWTAALKDVQESLGVYNDEGVALAHFRSQAAVDPKAWFAVGWLAARRESHAAACAKALKALSKIEPFWE